MRSVRSSRRRGLLVSSLALAAGMGWSTAHAADAEAAVAAEAPAIGEVIVTAERRETTLQKTPISVAAVGQAEMQERNIETLRDLMGVTAGLIAPTHTQNMQPLFIRGIGSFDPGGYAAVALYIDDIYIPRQFGNGLFDLPDVQRIEVLRGPQGTLYGQNSSGGAVKLVVKKPQATPSADIGFQIGNRDALQASLYATGPIAGDVLTASIAYTHRERDGYTWDPVLNRSIHALNTDQARAQIRFAPNDSFEAILSADVLSDRSDNATASPLNWAGAGPRTTFAGTDPTLKRDAAGVTLHLSYDASDWLTLKSISGYRELQDHPSPWDIDATPLARSGWVQNIKQHQYSEELQALADLGRLQLTAGGIYFNEILAFNRVTVQNNAYSELASDLVSDSLGAYAQANYRLTDKLKVTAGLRYGRDEQEFSNISYAISPTTGARTALVYRVDDLSDVSPTWSPKLGLDYQASPDLLLYGSWTRGNKAGGFNRAAGSAVVAAYAVEPEKVDAYEGGFKWRGLEGRAQVNAAAFYNDYKGYHANIVNPIIDGRLVPGNVIVNAGRAHTYGAEVETVFRPTESLDIRLSGAWLKTAFDEFANPTGAANTDYEGKKLPYAPEVSLGALVSWEPDVGLPGELKLNAGYRYVSAFFNNVANDPVTRVPPQTYLDGGAFYTLPDGRWTVSVTAQNLLDRTTRITATSTPTLQTLTAGYAPPRQVLFGVQYSF